MRQGSEKSPQGVNLDDLLAFGPRSDGLICAFCKQARWIYSPFAEN